MRVRVASGNVVPSEAIERRNDTRWEGEPRLCRRPPQLDEIVAPWRAADAVEQSLQRELGSLLRPETRPVVEPEIALGPGARQRTVRLATPSVELVLIEWHLGAH